MKKSFILFLLSFTFQAHSQQLINNMYLLGNVNQHSQAGLYSACWGYIAPNGREYAILGCWDGTAFIDITDTANIHEADFQPGLASCCREMKTYSHYAYITADGTTSPSGVQIIDLQYLPDSVHFVRTYLFSGFTKAHTISQSGPFLYINGGDYLSGGISVLDLTDPENPVRRGQWETWYVHDCRVINDTIYASIILSNGTQGDGSITIINAANKDNLITINHWVNNPQPGPHNSALTVDHKYCLVTDEINGNPRYVKIWDIQNLNNVTLASTWHPTGITTSICHNLEVYSNYTIVAHYTAGIRVVNISNPNSPVEAAWYDTYPQNDGFTYDGCWGVYMFPSQKIIASDRSTGLYVVKTTFPVIGIHSSEIPVYYSLKQNYPNPFNSMTQIGFEIGKEGNVEFEIYSSSGKEVKHFKGFYSEGSHNISFDAEGLPSGVYFYRLSVFDTDGIKFRDSKKLVLIK